MNESQRGSFSNWRCASADPLFGGAADGSLTGEFGVGVVAKDVEVPVIAGSRSCIVDLSFSPRRYLCADGETSLDAAATALAAGADAAERVYWIGEAQQVPISDFDPDQLRANLRMRRTMVSRVHSPGSVYEADYALSNTGGDISYATGTWVGLSRVLTNVSVIVRLNGEVTICDILDQEGVARCFIEALDRDETAVMELRALIDPNADPDSLDRELAEAGFDSDTPNDDPVEDEGSLDGRRLNESLLPDDFEEEDDFCDVRNPTLEIIFRCDLPFTVERPPGPGSTSSHPNLVTFDRRRYIFHGAGDYVLARSIVDEFEVQARFGRMDSNTVSFNQAIAARVGDSVVSFGDDNSLAFEPTVVRIDGEVITPTSTPIDLPGDATLIHTGSQFRIDWTDGTVLRVGLRIADPWTLYPGEGRWGRLEGLLGNADGNRKNDVVAADGTPFEFRSRELYDIFGASWLMDETTTLFESELDPNARLPIVPGGIITLADLPPAAIERAERLCLAGGVEAGAGLAECIFDVALTGDVRWITGLEFVNDILAQSISLLAERGLIEDDVVATVPGILPGEIDENGAVDLYRFNLEAGAAITVTSSSQCTNSSTFEFALESPSGVFVGRSKGPLCGRLGVFDLPEGGEYILRVYDSNGYTGQYTLQVALPESSQRVYRLDEVASGSIEAGGEAIHTFEVTQDGTELYYDSRGCGSGNQMQLLSAATGVVRDRGCFQEFTEIVDAGLYAVRIYSDDNSGGNYSFRMWDIPERSAPEPYELDVSQFGELLFPTDVDEWQFEIAEDGTEVFFDSQGCASQLRWELRDANGALVVARGCFQEFSQILDAGTWTVRVFSVTDSFGTYRFRVWEIQERQVFDYTLDVSQFGELTFPTDANDWQFEIANDGTEVFFDPQGCASQLRWELRDANGALVQARECFQEFSRVLDAGTWTIRVLSDNGSFGTYRFRVWEIQERQDFDYTLDVSQFGELTFPTDSNRYSFEIEADGTEVYFDPQGCASELRWELRDPNGAFVQARECFQDFSRILDAGTWTIRVFSDNDSFGTYRFRLWEIPDRENFDYTIGDTTNVVLSFPTDSERYSFDVAADGTTLVFDAQGCNPTAQRWQLISPTGSIIRTRNCFQDFTETVNAGSYTLRVYTDDDRFGTFQFQVREQ